MQVREGVGSTVEAAEATYGYTANGKRQTLIDGEGNRAKLAYDGHDRVYQWQFPSTTKAAAYDDSTPAMALATAGSANTTSCGIPGAALVPAPRPRAFPAAFDTLASL